MLCICAERQRIKHDQYHYKYIKKRLTKAGFAALNEPVHRQHLSVDPLGVLDGLTVQLVLTLLVQNRVLDVKLDGPEHPPKDGYTVILVLHFCYIYTNCKKNDKMLAHMHFNIEC